LGPAIIATLLAQASAVPPSTVGERPPEGVIIYRSASDDRGLAFSPRDRSFKEFYGPYRSEIWKSEFGGLLKIVHENGIDYERFTGTSVPERLQDRVSWATHGYICTPREYQRRHWSITCSGKPNLSYLFEEGRGVTGFYFPCQGKICWFKLETATGLFARVAS
jgi:hypothetical protein